tara:strand:+ start:866 stop:1186 length:321 start_codon:yes stop_codon:yes gene_type:complete
MEIDWNNILENTTQTVSLQETEIDAEHKVTFHEVRQTEEGFLVATVSSESLEGTTLWLKGKFGPQNGLMSLMKSAEGGENIEGNTFTFTRIESEKSPSGYAYRWTN